ncbi:MAG: hypothetical protein QGH20_12185, partial [Candidatus Latescibacteria bacterium]|nr:hypothetical protein [Candidatus Latescibacterota bacterium]
MKTLSCRRRRNNLLTGYLPVSLYIGMLWGSSLIPGNDPPSMPSVLGWDKLQHVAAFMFLAALVVRALSMTPWPQAHR